MTQDVTFQCYKLIYNLTRHKKSLMQHINTSVESKRVTILSVSQNTEDCYNLFIQLENKRCTPQKTRKIGIIWD